MLDSDLVCWSFLHSHRGVLVPGGFGTRGTEGKILAINWARKQNKPFLGKKYSILRCVIQSCCKQAYSEMFREDKRSRKT